LNTELRRKLDRFRSLRFGNPEELAQLLREKAMIFASEGLTAFGQLLSTIFGPRARSISPPEWLS
jgi:hypothetical protein